MEDLNIMISALGGEPALKDQELFLLKGESRVGIGERKGEGKQLRKRRQKGRREMRRGRERDGGRRKSSYKGKRERRDDE